MNNIHYYQAVPWEDVIRVVEVVPGTEGRYLNLYPTWDAAHQVQFADAKSHVQHLRAALKAAEERMTRIEAQRP